MLSFAHFSPPPAIGVGLLGVCVLAWWLFFGASRTDTPSPTAPSTTAMTATVSAAAASPTSLGPPTSLDNVQPSSSPTASPSPASDMDDSVENTMRADAKASEPKASETARSTSGSSAAKSSGTDSAASSSETWTGKATFYQQRGVAGNCGKVNAESALICALQTKLYADGKNCGRKIRLTRSDNGESVEVEVADQCPSCVEEGYVDLSEGAYDKLGTRDEGWFDMSWYFID
ncbi:uncharacterized protein RHOBADRAFT_47178 [Rhodotorula graminis WP1]|uniref:RlpA-like protein double-psi beta-barrel domain-containing protein n=1 Tax=Rhodotorula graminis (strain WP1) TaxID=578459 RepID=A0A0N8PZD2_RHOGW|nr:uncharacterized protein RHOBADRAFT_47178 [Rhodotorula graminis WP1]KPV71997.1 hypothetical protein RHOBADRAFT_47178 [Rhodotorula graminis WP1]